MTISDVKKLLAPLKNRVMLMFVRGILTTKPKQGGLQQIQMSGLADETPNGLEYVENYGFGSIPDVGAETLAVFMGGNRDHGVVIACPDRRTRPTTFASKDVFMWHSDGTTFALKGSGKVQLKNPAGNELVTVLSELMQFLINARTSTAIGDQPLFDVTGADTLVAIKTKLDTFKL